MRSPAAAALTGVEFDWNVLDPIVGEELAPPAAEARTEVGSDRNVPECM